MAIDGGFQEFLAEMFEPVGDVTFKSMFGGVGIFRYGLMFGLVFDDRVALKADQETEKDFLDEGLETSGPIRATRLLAPLKEAWGIGIFPNAF